MRILVTGGAGFIGSHLCDKFLSNPKVEFVRVVDNLLTGSYENIKHLENKNNFEFIEGDIRDYAICLNAMQGCTHVSHQAALGSVPRSINDPRLSNNINVTGTLNIFNAGKELGVQKIVFASSSSVYGDDTRLPKLEDITGNVLSPYALTKKTKEEYAKQFAFHYSMDITALRYFNVFGPRQSPKGPYAAVIPIFIDKLLKNESPTINGDGTQSRDFTYIENVVEANELALLTNNSDSLFKVYNVALGEKTTLNELYQNIAQSLNKTDIKPIHGPPRKGDIKDSLANIDRIKSELNYSPKVFIKEGLSKTSEWFINQTQVVANQS